MRSADVSSDRPQSLRRSRHLRCGRAGSAPGAVGPATSPARAAAAGRARGVWTPPRLPTGPRFREPWLARRRGPCGGVTAADRRRSASRRARRARPTWPCLLIAGLHRLAGAASAHRRRAGRVVARSSLARASAPTDQRRSAIVTWLLAGLGARPARQRPCTLQLSRDADPRRLPRRARPDPAARRSPASCPAASTPRRLPASSMARRRCELPVRRRPCSRATRRAVSARSLLQAIAASGTLRRPARTSGRGAGRSDLPDAPRPMFAVPARRPAPAIVRRSRARTGPTIADQRRLVAAAGLDADARCGSTPPCSSTTSAPMATTEERNRLAREMHDGVAQEIASLGYVVDEARAPPPSDRAAEQLVDRCATRSPAWSPSCGCSIFDLRNERRPSEGLGTALAEYVREIGKASGHDRARRAGRVRPPAAPRHRDRAAANRPGGHDQRAQALRRPRTSG